MHFEDPIILATELQFHDEMAHALQPHPHKKHGMIWIPVVMAIVVVTGWYRWASIEDTQVVMADQPAMERQAASSSSSNPFDVFHAPIQEYMTQSSQGTSEPVMVTLEEPEVPTVNPYNKQGVYLTATSIARADFFEETMDDLLAQSGSALVFDVKGSYVYFPIGSPLATDLKLVRPVYDLPAITQKAREKGIYTIARFIAIKDAGLTAALPEARIRHPKTGRVLSQDWIDPANEKALAYNMEVLCEIAQHVDEVNLDYIRFSTENYNALMVFSATEKADKVETFIRLARETIDLCHPQTKLGLSTYAILGWDYKRNVETLGQDVVRFAPLVDVISPMAYPATFTSPEYYDPKRNKGSRMYYLVHRTLTGYAELLGEEHRGKLRPWIQGYGVTTKNMTDQMQAVYDAGLCGFTVWNANNNYNVTYKALKQKPLPEACAL